MTFFPDSEEKFRVASLRFDECPPSFSLKASLNPVDGRRKGGFSMNAAPRDGCAVLSRGRLAFFPRTEQEMHSLTSR